MASMLLDEKYRHLLISKSFHSWLIRVLVLGEVSGSADSLIQVYVLMSCTRVAGLSLAHNVLFFWVVKLQVPDLGWRWTLPWEFGCFSEPGLHCNGSQTWWVDFLHATWSFALIYETSLSRWYDILAPLFHPFKFDHGGNFINWAHWYKCSQYFHVTWDGCSF